MAFMEPEVAHGLWWEIEHDHTDFVPHEAVGALPIPETVEFALGQPITEDSLFDKFWSRCQAEDHGASDEREQRARARAQTEETWSGVQEHFRDYIDCPDHNRISAVTLRDGWGARLSAPGFLDSTDWGGVFATEQEARDYLGET